MIIIPTMASVRVILVVDPAINRDMQAQMFVASLHLSVGVAITTMVLLQYKKYRYQVCCIGRTTHYTSDKLSKTKKRFLTRLLNPVLIVKMAGYSWWSK